MVYIDVSTLINTGFISGVQRVVREISTRLIEKYGGEIQLVAQTQGYYFIVDKSKFNDFYKYNIGNREGINKGRTFGFDELKEGDTLFDLDGTWTLLNFRSTLLPKLKDKKIKLIVYIYDVLPIKYPHFFNGSAVMQFINYFCAWIRYGDMVITSSQTVLNQVFELCDELNCKRPKGYVSWLGADFKKEGNGSSFPIDESVLNAVSKGKYILSVGTIEPRKNHKLLIDAQDNGLMTNLIFAGRFGWNIDELKNRIENHPLLGKRLFVLNNLSDNSIDFLYHNALMSVFASIDEGFGLPIVESLKRNTPVIASDIPVLREVGGNCCEYFDPYDSRAFAQKVNGFASNSDKFEELKMKADTYAEVTWDDVTEKIAGFLDL